MSTTVSTRSRVIQLYKQLIYLGREYPKEPDNFTAKIHAVFIKNAGETDAQKIEQLIDKGNYIVKELEALYSKVYQEGNVLKADAYIFFSTIILLLLRNSVAYRSYDSAKKMLLSCLNK